MVTQITPYNDDHQITMTRSMMTRSYHTTRRIVGAALLLLAGGTFRAGEAGHGDNVSAASPLEAPSDKERGLADEMRATVGSLPLYIEFGSGKTSVEELSANGDWQLTAATEALNASGATYQNLVIEAHTCGCREAGEDSSASFGRAQAVREYLLQHASSAHRSLYLKPFFASDLADNGTRRDLPPEQCEIDEVHAMDRRVVIRELSVEDLEDAARLIPPETMSILAKVSFWFRRAGNGDAFQRLLDDSVLRAGDEIRLFVIAAEPVYAYIFHRGSAGEWTCLFPNEQFSLEAPAANPVEPGRKYWLPGFGHGIPLDNTPGTEETFVYLSERADARMEQWVREGVPFLIGEGAGGAAEVASSEQAAGDDLAARIRTRGGIVHVRPDTAGVEWFARVRFNHTP